MWPLRKRRIRVVKYQPFKRNKTLRTTPGSKHVAAKKKVTNQTKTQPRGKPTTPARASSSVRSRHSAIHIEPRGQNEEDQKSTRDVMVDAEASERPVGERSPLAMEPKKRQNNTKRPKSSNRSGSSKTEATREEDEKKKKRKGNSYQKEVADNEKKKAEQNTIKDKNARDERHRARNKKKQQEESTQRSDDSQDSEEGVPLKKKPTIRASVVWDLTHPLHWGTKKGYKPYTGSDYFDTPTYD